VIFKVCVIEEEQCLLLNVDDIYYKGKID